jgi:Flp pilus assembly protein TadD
VRPWHLVDTSSMSDVTGNGAARRWWPLLLIVVVGLAAYANSFAGEFLLDDVKSIVENPDIRSFATVGGSRPAVEATLAMNYALGGVEPFGYHAFNLVVHLLAGLTLYGIVRRVVGVGPALAIALIWLVHPLQTQSVTYVIQRAESMAGLLYLLTIYGVLRCATSPTPRRWAALAIAACAIGLLTKPVVATAPIVALLFDATIITRGWREVWRRRWGLYAGLAATLPILVITGTLLSVLATQSEHHRSAGLAFEGCTPWQYLMTQPAVLLHYLKLSVWPAPLCFDYGWPFATSLGPVAVPLLVVTALFVGAVGALRSRKAIGFLGVTLFLILAPTSSVLPIADAAVEHRMYLPLACVVIAVVLGAQMLLTRLPEPRRSPVAIAATALVVVTLTGLTLKRNTDYHDPLRMWTSVLDQRPENPRAHNEIGKVLAGRGEMSLAADHFEVAVALMPVDPLFRSNMANACLQLQRLEEALTHAGAAVRMRPEYAAGHKNLGNALIAADDINDGIMHLREAVRLEPDDPWARCNLGRALALASGVSRPGTPIDHVLLDEGIAELNEALRRHAGFDEAVKLLAYIERLRYTRPERVLGDDEVAQTAR